MHLALTGCEPSKLRPAKLAELASFKFLFDEVEDGLDGDQIQVPGRSGIRRPFLERALSSALERLVADRAIVPGKPPRRRGRKQARRHKPLHPASATGWDGLCRVAPM
jgi:hypothetical protein